MAYQPILYDLGLTGDLLDDLAAQGIFITYHSNQLGDEWVTVQQGEVKLVEGDEGYHASVIATVNNLSRVATLVKALATARRCRGIRERAIQQLIQAIFTGTWDADDRVRVKRVWFEANPDGSTTMWFVGPEIALVFPPEWTAPVIPEQIKPVLEQHLAEYQARIDEYKQSTSESYAQGQTNVGEGAMSREPEDEGPGHVRGSDGYLEPYSDDETRRLLAGGWPSTWRATLRRCRGSFPADWSFPAFRSLMSPATWDRDSTGQ